MSLSCRPCQGLTWPPRDPAAREACECLVPCGSDDCRPETYARITMPSAPIEIPEAS